jgi:hypothetical protein
MVKPPLADRMGFLGDVAVPALWLAARESGASSAWRLFHGGTSVGASSAIHGQHDEQPAVPAAAAERHAAPRWRQAQVACCGHAPGGAGRAQTLEHPHDAVRSARCSLPTWASLALTAGAQSLPAPSLCPAGRAQCQSQPQEAGPLDCAQGHQARRRLHGPHQGAHKPGRQRDGAAHQEP